MPDKKTIDPALKKWFDKYEKKTGRKIIVDDTCWLVWQEDKGFLIMQPEPADKTLVISYMCGDGKYWERVAVEIANKAGLETFVFITRRNPKAFERMFGATLRSYIMERKVNI